MHSGIFWRNSLWEVLELEVNEIRISPLCMVAVYDDGTDEKFPYGSSNEIDRVADLIRHLKANGVVVPDRVAKKAREAEHEVFGVCELVSLKRTSYGFDASVYNTGCGGFSFRKFCGYSMNEVLSTLRKDGVVCPRRACQCQ